MKLPIVEVADIISAANFDWVDADNIYTTNVTPDEDDSGKTAFIHAVWFGFKNIVDALLKKSGLKADTKDNYGHDAEWYAQKKAVKI